MKRFVCIHFSNWSIQRLIVARPELRRQRIVLFSELANRGRLVAVASPLAVQSGVRIGMPLTEAKSLLRRAVLHLLPFEPEVDRQALVLLARRMHAFSPIVGVEQTVPPQSPQCLLLDITGVAHLFGDTLGNEEHLLSDSRKYLEQLGYIVQAAVADTIGQAWALACFAKQHSVEPFHSPSLSSLVKPVTGWTHPRNHRPLRQIISTSTNTTKTETVGRTKEHKRRSSGSLYRIAPIGTCWEMLDVLPPAALRLDAAICTTLSQLGIETIAQLRRLPRASLAARFGDELSRRLDQASGAMAEVLVAESESPTLFAQQQLDFPICDQASIQVVIEGLLGKLCDEMRASQKGALQWEIRLLCQSAAPRILRIGLFQPTTTVEHLMQLVAMQIEQQQAFDRNAAPIEEVTVAATRCVLLAERQRQLFDENPRRDPQTLAQLVDRLAIRLGAEFVVRPSLVAGAQPEYAFRYQPLVGGAALRRSSASRKTDDVMARPLCLFQPAQPLSVASEDGGGLVGRPAHNNTAPAHNNTAPAHNNTAPAHNNTAPAHNNTSENSLPTLMGRCWRLKIVRQWGPERIETGWWRGPTIRRDYWRIATLDGQQLWVYRDLKTGNWFLHGTY